MTGPPPMQPTWPKGRIPHLCGRPIHEDLNIVWYFPRRVRVNYVIFSPVLVNFAKLGIDSLCAGLRILLQMKKKHQIKNCYLYFQLFLVHWRLRWAFSAKVVRLKIKLFEKNDWRVLVHEINSVVKFYIDIFHLSRRD